MSQSRRYLLLLLIAGPATAEAEVSCTREVRSRAQALAPRRRRELVVSRSGSHYR